MTDRPTTHTMAAACGAELPTSAELEGMDVASAQQRAFVMAPNLSAARYEVDGKVASEQEAKAIGANRIASIEIRKQDKKSSVVRITTRNANVAAAGPTVPAKGTVIEMRVSGTSDSTRTGALIGRQANASLTFDGLIILDGVRSTSDAMNKLSPTDIESVEIVKGPAAEQQYGPEGAKGVIRITTKKK